METVAVVRDCAGYLPILAKGWEIRLRRKGTKCFLTFKSGHGLSRTEDEIELRELTFRTLWPLTRGARITKRRYSYRERGHIIELDVYQGALGGLMTAEVEFSSTRASRWRRKCGRGGLPDAVRSTRGN